MNNYIWTGLSIIVLPLAIFGAFAFAIGILGSVWNAKKSPISAKQHDTVSNPKEIQQIDIQDRKTINNSTKVNISIAPSESFTFGFLFAAGFFTFVALISVLFAVGGFSILNILFKSMR